MGLQASIQSGTATAALPPGAGAVSTRLREFLAFKLGPEECGLLALTQAGDKAQAQLLLMGSVRPVFVEWLASINHYIDLQSVWAMSAHSHCWPTRKRHRGRC